MIGLLLFLAGVVGLAINEQFHGQDVIATVLVIVGALILAIQIGVGIMAAATIRKSHREVFGSARNRRGF